MSIPFNLGASRRRWLRHVAVIREIVERELGWDLHRVEFARAKRRSANLTSEVDENRVTLMDDPRLSNYFASTEPSGKNRYGSSRKTARGSKLRTVDGGWWWGEEGEGTGAAAAAAAVVGGESSTSDRKKFSRRSWDALSIFLSIAARLVHRGRRTRRASIHEIFLPLSVPVTNCERRRIGRKIPNEIVVHYPSQPLPPFFGQGKRRRRRKIRMAISQFTPLVYHFIVSFPGTKNISFGNQSHWIII